MPEGTRGSIALPTLRAAPLVGSRRLAAVFVALLLLALVVRIGEIQRTSYTPTGDARSYVALAGQISQFGDYSRFDGGAGGSLGPTAYFPPAYPYLLAAADVLDGSAPGSTAAVQVDQLVGVLLGTATVGLIGLIALELFGIEVSIAALAIAAVYPPLIELSGVLAAENLLVALELAAVWTILRARRSRDSLPWLLATGALVGLAALTHVNGLLLVIPIAFLARGTRPVVGRRPVSAHVSMLVALLLTLSPWLIRDATVMHRFVPISDESGITLAGTYNPTSAAASDPPFKWIYYRDIPSDRQLAREARHLTELQLSDRLTSRALDYIGRHPAAPLEAAGANLLRLLELDGGRAWRTSAASLGIDNGTAEIGVIGFWIVAILGALAIVTPRARQAPRWLWGVPAVMTLGVIFVNAETPRFRATIDPFVILLAACLLAPVVERVRQRFLNWQYAKQL